MLKARAFARMVWPAMPPRAPGGSRSMVWQPRKVPQMHQLLDREDPYSYYRGQSENMRNLTPKERVMKVLWIGVPLASIAALAYKWYREEQEKEAAEHVKGEPRERQTLINWSGTHQVIAKKLWEPESLAELEQLVINSHTARTKLRVTGAGLSPNGISFERGGMVSLALMDKIVNVDTKKRQVTVEAGCTVERLLEALRPYGLTLENLASINQQQLGGFIQVSAHGTGATLPPVDNQLVSMKIVTPANGTLLLSKDDPEQLPIFNLAKVGLGMQGIVAEVTLQCVPAHQLVERTWVSNMKEISSQHNKLLTENRHLRYMWIPYTDTVVVVASNPKKSWWHPGALAEAKPTKPLPDDVRLAPMRKLLQELGPKTLNNDGGWTLDGMSLATLRDELLKIDPLNTEHVKRVNAAEAECWKMSQGVRIDWTDNVLGFECGGQQWVSEVAFPAGQVQAPDGTDLEYTRELMKMIEEHNIPAPAPLEQRWTSASSSPMSPASSPNPNQLFSWLGIIMYLPPDDQKQRDAIKLAFAKYKQTCADKLWGKYRCAEHWAKLDVTAEGPWFDKVKARLRERFPIGEFNVMRTRMDPHGICASKALAALFDTQSG